MMKRLTACFYRAPGGREPVKEWPLSLDAADRRIVGQDIATVEFGWPVGMPICRPLRAGLREVRSTIKSGRVEARVYFVIDADRMLLLHGHEGKGGQKDAIELALRRWNSGG